MSFNIFTKIYYGANSKKYETVIFGSGSNASSPKISMKATYHKLSHKKGSKLQKPDEINSILEQFVFLLKLYCKWHWPRLSANDD
jgi:hypothetical protein